MFVPSINWFVSKWRIFIRTSKLLHLILFLRNECKSLVFQSHAVCRDGVCMSLVYLCMSSLVISFVSWLTWPWGESFMFVSICFISWWSVTQYIYNTYKLKRHVFWLTSSIFCYWLNGVFTFFFLFLY